MQKSQSATKRMSSIQLKTEVTRLQSKIKPFRFKKDFAVCRHVSNRMKPLGYKTKFRHRDTKQNQASGLQNDIKPHSYKTE